MKILKKYTNVFSFFKVKDSLVKIERDEIKREQISQILGGKRMKTHYLRSCGDYLYDFEHDKIIIYDSGFNHLFDLKQKGFKSDNTSIDFIDEKNLMISQSVFGNNDEIISKYNYYTNLKIKSDGEYCGKFLNKQYRLNFKKEERYNNPTYFRLSDILDTETYFEYQCEEGCQIVNQFYVWKDTFIFMYSNNIELILIQKNINTGNTVWYTNIESPDFSFDSEKGIMVSIWGKSAIYKDSIDQYQIIYLEKQIVEVNRPIKDFNFAQVESHMGTFFYNNKLYFSDNPFSYAGHDPNVPSVGCFDIETKKINFMQKIPEMSVSSIANIICNDEKLYVRSDNGDLIVYEI